MFGYTSYVNVAVGDTACVSNANTDEGIRGWSDASIDAVIHLVHSKDGGVESRSTSQVSSLSNPSTICHAHA
jgi:hypothetical protein